MSETPEERAAAILKEVVPEIRRYIAECTNIEDVVAIKEMAEDIANLAEERKSRAERGIGKILLDGETPRPLRTLLGVQTNAEAQKLARHCREIARLPDYLFEDFIAECQKDDGRSSREKLLRLTRSARRDAFLERIRADSVA